MRSNWARAAGVLQDVTAAATAVAKMRDLTRGDAVVAGLYLDDRSAEFVAAAFDLLGMNGHADAVRSFRQTTRHRSGGDTVGAGDVDGHGLWQIHATAAETDPERCRVCDGLPSMHDAPNVGHDFRPAPGGPPC